MFPEFVFAVFFCYSGLSRLIPLWSLGLCEYLISGEGGKRTAEPQPNLHPPPSPPPNTPSPSSSPNVIRSRWALAALDEAVVAGRRLTAAFDWKQVLQWCIDFNDVFGYMWGVIWQQGDFSIFKGTAMPLSRSGKGIHILCLNQSTYFQILCKRNSCVHKYQQ